MKKTATAILLSLWLCACQNPNQQQSNLDRTKAAEDAAKQADDAIKAADAALDGTSWSYGAFQDKMTDKVTRYATLNSSDNLPEVGPYNASPLEMTIYDDGAIIFFSKGGHQFNCSNDDYCTLNARFDGGKQIEFAASENSNGTPTISLNSFVENDYAKRLGSGDFLTAIAGAKKALIQVPIFDGGYPVVTFNVEGFKKEDMAAAKP